MTRIRNRIAVIAGRRAPNAGVLAAILFVFAAGGTAMAQALAMLPVTIEMPPGQLTAVLSMINQGESETAVQVRAFDWNQSGANGSDQLTDTDALQTSPPLTKIAPGATQTVRLVLHRTPQGKEATYRILLDQILPPAQPGVVQIALRVSIPIFAEPVIRTVAHMQYRVERDATQAYLVATNDGGHHETLRDIALTTTEGRTLNIETNVSPYVLAGATRRWRIVDQVGLPAPGGTLYLTARADAAAAVDQPVTVVASP
jgi:fimbrial chaperone protein